MVTALAPYKRIDLAVRAFNRNKKPLVVVGSGPLMDSLQKESEKKHFLVRMAAGGKLEKTLRRMPGSDFSRGRRCRDYPVGGPSLR